MSWAATVDGAFVPQFVSAPEAAELLGVSQAAVCAMCRRGRSLPGATWFARQWLIPLVDVERRLWARGQTLTVAQVRAVVGEPPPPDPEV